MLCLHSYWNKYPSSYTFHDCINESDNYCISLGGKKTKTNKMHAKHNEEIKTFSDTAEKIHSSS